MTALQTSTALSNSLPHDPDEVIPIPHLAREMMRAGLIAQPVTYKVFWNALASGLITAEPLSKTNNRQGIRRSNLGFVASALKLKPVEQAAA